MRKVEEKAVKQNIIYYVLAKAYFRDGLLLRFSQKAGFLRGARFARNNTDIYVTTEFFREFVLFVLNTFIKKKMVLFKFYLPNEIRKILILRKARGAVKRRKNKQSLL